MDLDEAIYKHLRLGYLSNASCSLQCSRPKLVSDSFPCWTSFCIRLEVPKFLKIVLVPCSSWGVVQKANETWRIVRASAALSKMARCRTGDVCVVESAGGATTRRLRHGWRVKGSEHPWREELQGVELVEVLWHVAIRCGSSWSVASRNISFCSFFVSRRRHRRRCRL